MKKWKKTLYPKTQRISNDAFLWQVTEKLDGSNLTLFRHCGELWVATRNQIFCWDDVESKEDIGYKGLYAWLTEHAEAITNCLGDGQALCGEWIGMGHIKYKDSLQFRFYVFARAAVFFDDRHDTFSMIGIDRDVSKLKELIDYLGLNSFMGVVPIIFKRSVIDEYDGINKLNSLDDMYDSYKESVDRDVEGFIVTNLYTGQPFKYVRQKGNKLEPHQEGMYVRPTFGW